MSDDESKNPDIDAVIQMDAVITRENKIKAALKKVAGTLPK